LLNRFHGKVCVASVDHFKKCNLWITSTIHNTFSFEKG
jgi:hypothetical protein